MSKNNNEINIVKYIKNKELFIGLILLIIIFSFLSRAFISVNNITNILLTSSIGGILGVGLTIIMISGDFDLSFATATGLINIIILILLNQGFNLSLVFFIAILLGILWQAINGLLVVKLGMHAFIATIATWTVCKGLIYWITGGSTYYGEYPKTLTIIGRGTIGMFPVSSIVFAVFAFITILAMNYSKFGRHVYAVGDNSLAAEYVGINSKKTRMYGYLINGFFLGLASIIFASKMCSGPSAGAESFQINVIAAVFLGATVFKPGVVNIGGTILGTFLLTVIENGLIMANVHFYFKYIIQGLIIIIAIAYIDLQGKKKNRGPKLV